jgi:hypothetical protein
MEAFLEADYAELIEEEIMYLDALISDDEI